MVLLERCKALEFLEKIGVKDWEASLSENPLAFLNDLLPAFMAHVPFQSISMVAVPKEERRVPTLEEVVESGLSLEGGPCFNLNIFMCILLRTLDLDAHVLDGTYTASHYPHNHVVVLVKNLRSDGEDYIIDVGGGEPFKEAVAVSSLPITFYHAGLEYRYCRRGDRVLRLSRTGDLKPDKEEAVMLGEWRQVFDFSLNTVDYDYFRPYMEKIYVDDESPFFQVMRAVRFPPADVHPCTEISSIEKNGSIQETNKETKAFPDDDVAAVDEISGSECETKSKMVHDNRIMLAMRNQSLLLGPMSAVVKTKISADDWANKIKHFFPTIPSAKVDLAVQNKLAMSSLH